jgi:hypothetical protein
MALASATSLIVRRHFDVVAMGKSVPWRAQCPCGPHVTAEDSSFLSISTPVRGGITPGSGRTKYRAYYKLARDREDDDAVTF